MTHRDAPFFNQDRRIQVARPLNGAPESLIGPDGEWSPCRMDSNDATQRETFQTSMWQRIADWALVALFVAIDVYGRTHLGWPIEIVLLAWMIPASYRFARQFSASPKLAGPHRPRPILLSIVLLAVIFLMSSLVWCLASFFRGGPVSYRGAASRCG